MTTIETSLVRLETAITRLERALDTDLSSHGNGVDTPHVPELAAERDRLEGEVEQLRARAQEDARLRQEAADAVRQALQDLRGAVGEGAPANA